MKENNNSNASGGGLGFAGVLTIVFIVLKLLGKITWSWLWVLSPIWIFVIIEILLLIIYFISFFIATK